MDILIRFGRFLSHRGQKTLYHSLLRLPIDILLSPDVSFEGELLAQNLVRVEGKAKGTIRSLAVVVAEEAKMVAEVETQCLYVKGHFQGIVRTQMLYVDSTGSVDGEIKTEVLHIDKGARMKGKVSVEKKKGG
ncbi:MAG: bactofilin family protein [Candidatus Caldatribacteriaceae bacterium]